MRGMNTASVDLIYLDPPFNSKTNYAAPIGSMAAGAAFKDTWTLTDLDAEWINLIESKHPDLWRVLLAAMRDSDKSYLVYMAVRLLEMRRLLKPTGSIYLHCDPTMSHYLKLLMDAVFGHQNFRNEIIWCYSPTGGGRLVPSTESTMSSCTSAGQKIRLLYDNTGTSVRGHSKGSAPSEMRKVAGIETLAARGRTSMRTRGVPSLTGGMT